MNIRYLTLLTALAFVGFSATVGAHPCERDNSPSHKHCTSTPPPPDPDPVAEYTAELVLGAFRFGAVDVTLNKRGNTYSSTVKLDMVRPLNGIDVPSGQPDWTIAEQNQWDAVFAMCPELFSSYTVGSVMASDNWSIDNSGGKNGGTVGSNIRISFRDVSVPGFPAADLDFALIGVLEDKLPPSSDPVLVELTEFNFFGAGVPPVGCNSGTLPLYEYSYLEITLK